MKRNLIYFLLLLLTSCELPFDLKEIGDRSILKLYCNASSGDTVVVDVDVLVPVGYHDRTPAEVGAEDVMMTVDGERVEIRTAAADDPNLEPGTMFVLEEFPSGAEICISASVEGVEPIEAKTRMPSSLDGCRLELELTDIVTASYDGEKVRNIVRARLELPEDLRGCHLGVQYMVNMRRDSCGVRIEEGEFVQQVYDVKGFSSDGNFISNPDFWHLRNMGYTYIYVWEGTDDYELLFNHYRDNVSEWENEDGTLESWSTDYSFKLVLYAMSEEYYQYHSRTTNRFFELGMASPSYTYTNVKGGTGLLGAVHSIETPWIDDHIFSESDNYMIDSL